MPAALAACCLALAGCGASSEAPPAQAAVSPGAAQPAAGPARPAGGAEPLAPPGPKKTAATNTPRRNPFAPVVDPAAARAGQGAETGPLEPKGILQGSVRAALIQEGQNVHLAHVGEHVGGLTVLEIRESEVVLGAGPRKRVLPLYAQ